MAEQVNQWSEKTNALAREIAKVLDHEGLKPALSMYAWAHIHDLIEAALRNDLEIN